MGRVRPLRGGSGRRLSTRDRLKTLSFDAGYLTTAEFGALNPRRRVPVLVDGDFALAESAAIVEYIEDRRPTGPLLSHATCARAQSSVRSFARPMSISAISASASYPARTLMKRSMICAASSPAGRRPRSATFRLTNCRRLILSSIHSSRSRCGWLAGRRISPGMRFQEHVSLHGSIAWKRFDSFRKLGPRTGSRSLRLDLARGAPIVESGQRLPEPRRLMGA